MQLGKGSKDMRALPCLSLGHLGGEADEQRQAQGKTSILGLLTNVHLEPCSSDTPPKCEL